MDRYPQPPQADSDPTPQRGFSPDRIVDAGMAGLAIAGSVLVIQANAAPAMADGHARHVHFDTPHVINLTKGTDRAIASTKPRHFKHITCEPVLQWVFATGLPEPGIVTEQFYPRIVASRTGEVTRNVCAPDGKPYGKSREQVYGQVADYLENPPTPFTHTEMLKLRETVGYSRKHVTLTYVYNFVPEKVNEAHK